MYKKVLLICASYHHNNTYKIAQAMGEELDAKIIKPEELDIDLISEYDLVGFGSGIYNGQHHSSLVNLIDQIKEQDNKNAFIFSTSTIPYKTIHKKLSESLVKKGFNVIGEFKCKGFMDYGFTKHFGGINKGKPNENDVEKAREFARKINNF